MSLITVYTPDTPPDPESRASIVRFLYEELEQYGDPEEHISKCMAYALKERESFGGFVVTMSEDTRLLGVTIVNKTGMGGYIPDYILVYIATHRDARGKGVGRKLIEKVFEEVDGDVALHVEPDNPARHLYEKVGFTNKYLEMRYKSPA